MNTLLRTLQLLSLALLLSGCASHHGKQQNMARWLPQEQLSQEQALSFYQDEKQSVLVSNKAIELMGIDLKQPSYSLDSNNLNLVAQQNRDLYRPPERDAFPLIRWRAHWK